VSLRDALVAKGLVSKKDARRVNQEAQADRRAAQGARRAKSEVESEAAVALREAEEAAVRERAAARRARELAREADERAIQVRQLIRANQIRSRGKYRFYHRAVDGRRIARLEVSDHVAWALRCGECAVVAIFDGPEATYGVVNARAATRLLELAPERVVHFVVDTKGLSDPAEALITPEWEISLRPRRWATS
jgi:uncharacterized protein YaiL (DUF2058 family)